MSHKHCYEKRAYVEAENGRLAEALAKSESLNASLKQDLAEAVAEESRIPPSYHEGHECCRKCVMENAALAEAYCDDCVICAKHYGPSWKQRATEVEAKLAALTEPAAEEEVREALKYADEHIDIIRTPCSFHASILARAYRAKTAALKEAEKQADDLEMRLRISNQAYTEAESKIAAVRRLTRQTFQFGATKVDGVFLKLNDVNAALEEKP